LERARLALAERGIDGALVSSPGLVAFLTGHVMPGHLGFPSRDGRQEKPTLALVTATDAVTVGVAPRPGVGDAYSYGDGGSGLADGPDAYAALAEAITALGLTHGRLATEAGLLPAAAIEAVRAAAPQLETVPLNDALRYARAPKSDSELAGLREALALCDAGQDAVRAAVAPGATEGDLYAAAVAAMIARAGDYVVPLAEIQVGARGELGMGGATAAAVRDGELAMSDIAPRHPNGWWGDSCLTVACGEPGADVRVRWRRLMDGLEAGRESLRPGVTAGEVYAAVARHAGEQPGHAGHAIGRDHYEEPKIVSGSPEPLVEGAVIVLEPGHYADGRGLRVEHAFRVTTDGGEPLSVFGLEL
jgi:Xaa-Pro aminopeptidase